MLIQASDTSIPQVIGMQINAIRMSAMANASMNMFVEVRSFGLRITAKDTNTFPKRDNPTIRAQTKTSTMIIPILRFEVKSPAISVS